MIVLQVPNIIDFFKELSKKITTYITTWKSKEDEPDALNWLTLVLITSRTPIYIICMSLIMAESLVGCTTELQSTLVLSSGITTAASLYTVTGKNSRYIYYIGLTYVTFLVLTFYFVKTDGMLVFFIIYELFLLPSTLLVWSMSPNKRGVMTSSIFLLWTQLGSIFVLLGLFAARTMSGSDSIYLYNINTNTLSLVGQVLLLIGFLMKIPTFPFYFWLVKTHVEVATSFSIFLSGFLVKVALFGLYKFFFLFGTFTKLLAIYLAFSSSMVTSTLFLFQTDLKKVVAYATIQEMGQLVLVSFVIQDLNVKIVSTFTLTHTLLSISFFYIVDILYRHHLTRSSNAITGVFTTSPKLAIFIVFFLAMFRGLPFSLKNSVEFNLLGNLFAISAGVGLLWLFFIVMVGNLTFSYVFLKALVFAPNKHLPPLDTSRGESLTFTFGGSILVFGSYMFF